jgi:hypothetical protein
MSIYSERKQQGLCGYCGKGECDCKVRRNELNNRRRRLKTANGLCRTCSRPRTKGVYCQPCWEWRRKYKPKPETLEVKAARSYRKNYGLEWKPLKAKFDKQTGRCAISGVQITIGRNAELDHIIPKAKGGTNTIENLQWVHSTVNRIKGALLLTELVKWCDLILNNATQVIA